MSFTGQLTELITKSPFLLQSTTITGTDMLAHHTLFTLALTGIVGLIGLWLVFECVDGAAWLINAWFSNRWQTLDEYKHGLQRQAGERADNDEQSAMSPHYLFLRSAGHMGRMLRSKSAS